MGDGPVELEDLSSSLIPLLARLNSTVFDLARLGEGLRKMALLANYVNRHAQQPQFWEISVKSTLLVGPAAHCILTIPRPDLLRYLNENGYYLTFLQETVRLVLLILLAALKKAFPLVADELGLFLERLLILTPRIVGLPFFPELRRWAYLVDVCAREDPISHLQVSEIRRAMRDLQVQKSEDAVAVAKNIIWIPYLLDGNIERAKEQIDQHSTASDNAG